MDDPKVTDEMIKAGLGEISDTQLIDAWEGYLGKTDLIMAIYLAMTKAKHTPK